MSFSVEGETVCLPRVIRTASGLVEDAVLLDRTNDSSEIRRLARRVAGNAADLLSETELLLVIVGDMAVENIPEMSGINFGEAYVGFRDSDLMKKDLPAIADLLIGIADSGVIDAFRGGSYDPTKVDLDTMADTLGTALNATDSLAKLKATVIREAVRELISSQGEITDSLQALLDAVAAIPEMPYGAEEARKEGESLTMILNGILLSSNSDKISGEGVGYLIEGLARHPAIDVDVVMDAAADLLTDMGLSADSSSDFIVKPLKQALLESLNKPITETTFPNLTDTAVNTVDTLQGIVNGEVNTESVKEMLSADTESLSTMKEMVTEEFLTDFGLGEEAAKINVLLGTMFDAIAENDLTEEELGKEAAALSDALITFHQAAGMTETDAAAHFMENADELLDDCLSSQIITDTLDTLTENGESDPLALFTGLDENDKAALETKIDELDVDDAAAETLKQFMGLTN